MLGDQFDDLLGEERGIDIGDEQSARPLGDRSVHGSMTVPFPITVIPDSVTTQPRARSAVSSRPIWVREGITTFLSMRSAEHTSGLPSRGHLVCRLLIE